MSDARKIYQIIGNKVKIDENKTKFIVVAARSSRVQEYETSDGQKDKNNMDQMEEPDETSESEKNKPKCKEKQDGDSSLDRSVGMQLVRKQSKKKLKS